MDPPADVVDMERGVRGGRVVAERTQGGGVLTVNNEMSQLV